MKKETMKCRKEIRLYSWELEELQKQAEKMGLSDSQYLRMLITNRPRDYPEIRKELERIPYFQWETGRSAQCGPCSPGILQPFFPLMYRN